jgi:hypothetical protein
MVSLVGYKYFAKPSAISIDAPLESEAVIVESRGKPSPSTPLMSSLKVMFDLVTKPEDTMRHHKSKTSTSSC